MAHALVIAPSKKHQSPFETHVAGIPLRFAFRVREDGSAPLSAELDLEEPNAPAAIQSLRALRFDVLLPSGMAAAEGGGDAEVVDWSEVAVVPAKVRPDARSALAALQAGWDLEDLVGTGRGGAVTASGGLSLLTGLSLLELSLTVPPRDWPQRRATLYPWQIEGWAQPTQSWKPPTLPAKSDKGLRYLCYAQGYPAPVGPKVEKAQEPKPAPVPVHADVEAPQAVAPAPTPSSPAPAESGASEDDTAFSGKLRAAIQAGGDVAQAAQALLEAHHASTPAAFKVVVETLAARPDAPESQIKSAVTRVLGRDTFPAVLVPHLITLARA